MLNESKMVKYFKNAWKEKIFVEAREDSDELLICDSKVLVKVSVSLKLFNDRAMFPELPTQPGECFTYGKWDGFHKHGPKMYTLIEDLLKENLKELTITPWLYFNKINTARLFYAGEKYLFANQIFLELFDGPYKAYSALHSASSPIILININDDYDDCLNAERMLKAFFAMIMPTKLNIITDEDKFPAIPDLRCL